MAAPVSSAKVQVMNAYFDSAVIVKLYVQESNSADAIRLVSADTAPCALTH